MRLELLTRRGTRLALLAASVAAISGAVMAQQNTALPEVRVQASGVVKKQVGKTSSGIPIETAEVTIRVSYADLPLDMNSGQALLKDRVADAARDACRRITSTYPRSTRPTDDECVKAAINGAKPQIDVAIAAAKAPKTGAQQ